MNKLKSIVNSQRFAILLLIILNLLQFRELGLIRLKIKEMAHQLTLVELEIERYRDLKE
jgi:hypothetical protein